MGLSSPIFLIAAFVVAAPAAMGAARAEANGTVNSFLGDHDFSQRVSIDADRMAADIANKSVLYTGNVVLIQGSIKLAADAVKLITPDGNLPQNIQATGHVVISSPNSGTVTGDTGLYDAGAHAVVMTGNVVMKRGDNVMRGTRLSVNLITGQAVLGAPGATPGQDGRVHGDFGPPPSH